MKHLFIGLLFSGFILQVGALSPKLNRTVSLLKTCMNELKVPLCDTHFVEMVSELRRVDTDARGEFVYVLKDVLSKNDTENVVLNLYEKLSILAPIYIDIDGTNVWSGRDMLLLLDDISLKYLKYVPLESNTLIDLFKAQRNQNSRYKFLGALHSLSKNLTLKKEIEEVLNFGVFAKSYIKGQGDEYYVFQSAVNLIKKLTLKNLAFVRGFEGVYKIELHDTQANRILGLDHIVISSSDDKNGLLVNFSSSKYRASKFKFKGAVLLGHSVLSNERVYQDRNDLAYPEFKFDIDFESTGIKGTFYTKRFGAVEFVGHQIASDRYLYSEIVGKHLTVHDLPSVYPVQVGSYSMFLRIEEGNDGVEMSLVNDNALIVFSRLLFNSEFNLIKAIDWKSEKILELRMVHDNGSLRIDGHYINSNTAQVFKIKN